MNLLRLTLILLVIFIFAESQIFAQPKQVRGMNRGSITRLYNSKTVETFEGNIIKVEKVSGYGRFEGIVLQVKAKKEKISVYVAPAWYLDEQKIEFKKGETIKVTGSHITYLGKPLVVSSEFTYDKKKSTLRNEYGRPVWAGKGMGPGQGQGGNRK